jgi:hypothetical protein
MKKIFALFAYLIAATLSLASIGLMSDDTGMVMVASGLFLVGTIVLSAALGATLWSGE